MYKIFSQLKAWALKPGKDGEPAQNAGWIKRICCASPLHKCQKNCWGDIHQCQFCHHLHVLVEQGWCVDAGCISRPLSARLLGELLPSLLGTLPLSSAPCHIAPFYCQILPQVLQETKKMAKTVNMKLRRISQVALNSPQIPLVTLTQVNTITGAVEHEPFRMAL